MAAIHTPTPLSTAMGLIAAVLIGQIAIDVGLFVPEVILYVAVAAIGNFATPSYELGVANKLARLGIINHGCYFSYPRINYWDYGIYHFTSKNTFFQYPLFMAVNPISSKSIYCILLFEELFLVHRLRPSIVHTENRVRQPKQ